MYVTNKAHLSLIKIIIIELKPFLLPAVPTRQKAGTSANSSTIYEKVPSERKHVIFIVIVLGVNGPLDLQNLN